MNNSTIHIGTSGWSYRHWTDVFYPQHVKPAGYLEYYVTRFGCVELNSSFYHLPKKNTISGWIKRTPVNFRFCPKISGYITHHIRLVNSDESLKKFFNLFSDMKSKLGPVLIQLPPGLVFKKNVITDFFEILEEHYGDYSFAIEARNKSWINDECFNLLKKYNVAHVIADSGERFPYSETITADFIYLRFHGHEQLYASDYSESEIERYADKILKWKSGGRHIWVFFNNDFNGFAVKNASRLIELTGAY